MELVDWWRWWWVMAADRFQAAPPLHSEPDQQHSCEHKHNCSCCCSSALASPSATVSLSAAATGVAAPLDPAGCRLQEDRISLIVIFRVQRLFPPLVPCCNKSPALWHMADGRPPGSPLSLSSTCKAPIGELLKWQWFSVNWLLKFLGWWEKN